MRDGAEPQPSLRRLAALRTRQRDLGPAAAETEEDEITDLGIEHVIVETDYSDGTRRNATAATLARVLQTSTSQNSPPRGSGQFKITYQYLSAMTADQKASFEYAADRLGRMITTKHNPVSVPSGRYCSMAGNIPLPSTIGDLFIFVRIKDIDGVSKVLGQAGPCILVNGFPRVGYVEFDRADVQQMIQDKSFDAVCVHEIAHIMGFGTLWPDHGLVGGTAQNPVYIGEHGNAGLDAIGGSFLRQVPVQDTGGTGTAGSHWRDAALGDEMMTAYLSNQYQPLSAVSVEAFRDLGYSVDSSVADSFTVSPTGYPVGDSPYKPEEPTRPTWMNWDTHGLSNTTIWIIACIAVAVVVFTASLVYSKIVKRRLNAPKPQTTGNTISTMRSSNMSQPYPQGQLQTTSFVTTQNNQAYIPTAQPVAGNVPTSASYAYPAASTVLVLNDRDINSFMEVTQCADRHVAITYLQVAGGNLALAIERYVDQPSRPVTIT